MVDHYLHRCPSSLAIFPRYQLLGDDHRQTEGELRADFTGAVSREEVNEAGDRSASVFGVQGRDDHVTCFRGSEGESRRLLISHFADEDDIGIFSQCTTKATAKRCQMLTEFSL